MATVDKITAFVMAEQAEIFRLAQRDMQLHLKQIADLSGIPYASLKLYARGENQMPITAIKRLLSIDGFAPLLSRLFVPEGFALVGAHEEDDHDGLAADCIEYAGEHARARHPNSPGGVDIVPAEAAALNAKAVKLRRAA